MKTTRIIALVLVLATILSCVSVASAYNYTWRYSDKTFRQGDGKIGTTTEKYRHYIAQIQGDINFSGKGNCGPKRDGIYGPKTVNGVKSYQRSVPVTADGKAGYYTKSNLYADYGCRLPQFLVQDP